MSSDENRREQAPAWRQMGMGMPPTFRCALCGNPKHTSGRKLQRVQGLKQYVCAGCARPKGD